MFSLYSCFLVVNICVNIHSSDGWGTAVGISSGKRMLIDHRQPHPADGYSGAQFSSLHRPWWFFKGGHSCSQCHAQPPRKHHSWVPTHRLTLLGQLGQEATVKPPLHRPLPSWWQLLVALPTSGP